MTVTEYVLSECMFKAPFATQEKKSENGINTIREKEKWGMDETL